MPSSSRRVRRSWLAWTRQRSGQIVVDNDGPALPTGMEGRLFESMVSVRPSGDAKEPHLGLGQHIVRVIAQFRSGVAAAANRPVAAAWW
jgi:nitrogen-specific signal transduction histidine kinase